MSQGGAHCRSEGRREGDDIVDIGSVVGGSILGSFDRCGIPGVTLTLLITLVINVIVCCICHHFCANIICSHDFTIALINVSILAYVIALSVDAGVIVSLNVINTLSVIHCHATIGSPVSLLCLF